MPDGVLRHHIDGHDSGAAGPADLGQLSSLVPPMGSRAPSRRPEPNFRASSTRSPASCKRRPDGTRHRRGDRVADEYHRAAHRPFGFDRLADAGAVCGRPDRAADVAASDRLPLLLHGHPADPASAADDHHRSGARRAARFAHVYDNWRGDGDWSGHLAGAARMSRLVLRRDPGAGRHQPDHGDGDNGRSTCPRPACVDSADGHHDWSPADARARGCPTDRHHRSVGAGHPHVARVFGFDHDVDAPDRPGRDRRRRLPARHGWRPGAGTIGGEGRDPSSRRSVAERDPCVRLA